ncbi:MAG: DNA gyrase subunit A [Actinobacteria bacterium]|nr:DNA gyrase subunit A [Actinomycetota bacterium]
MVLDGKIKVIEIEDEMKKSYLDYAMSVIVGRALPDARDGLKPVHRRVLYAMYEMGMYPDRQHRKCARIVGEVLGKYHPHGDVAVYDTLVRMAQDFSMRYLLIDGHGNFGSVDGDNPAAMRYTEARLSKLAMEMLRDIDKETVDFVNNFDNTLQEPVVLPSRFPNLLVNGSSGIAVGMATNIPPHNLSEVIDGAIVYIENPDITMDQLLKIIKGPDFPTGGLIMGRDGIRSAYERGRGIIKMRGRAHVEQTKSGRSRIVVTEIPFQVNKARLIEKIAELVREKKISDISDLRDESDRSGLRVVIELKREAVPQVVLNQLYKHTQLQESFGVIMLALVDGVPRTLSLPQVIGHYVNFQFEVVVRRTKFELARAEKRAHILAGLLIALANLDEVIRLIKTSKTVLQAKERLMKKFKLSEEQAQAILDMRLQRLTGLEREKIAQEHKELLNTIAYLKGVLADDRLVYEIIKKELRDLKKQFGDERKTEIAPDSSDLEIEDLIADEDVVISITHSGYIKRLPVDTYRRQKRGGRGVLGMDLKKDDFVEHLFICSTHHYILFFSNRGKVYRVKVHELPTGSRTTKGQAIVNILPFGPEEKVEAVIATRRFDTGDYLLMATKKGIVKKTPLTEYDTSRREGLIAISLQQNDELISVLRVKEESEVILVSRGGQAIRFKERDVRAMGRGARGVRGIRLEKGDELLGMDIALQDADLFLITAKGYGKRTPIADYSLQRRGGKGVRAIKTVESRGRLAAMKVVKDNHELLIISTEGVLIRLSADGISRMGRHTQGVKIMNMDEEDKVSSVARVVAEDGG